MWGLLMEEDSTPEMAAKVATCAWALWGNRNEVRIGGQRKFGLTLFQKAVQFLEEYYVVWVLTQAHARQDLNSQRGPLHKVWCIR